MLTVLVLEISPVLEADEEVHVVLAAFALDVFVLDPFVLDAFVLDIFVLPVFVLGALPAENYAFLVADKPHVFGLAVLVVAVHVGPEAVSANVKLMDGLAVSEHCGDLRCLVQACFEHATSTQVHDPAW